MSNITSSSYPVVTDSQGRDQFAIVRNGQLVKMTRAALQEYIASLTPDTLLELTDTPGSYVGQQGRGLVVNNTESGLVFAPTVASNFLSLTDTPANYAGFADQKVRVNASANGLTFSPDAFINHIDTPASYEGAGGYVLQVNSGATGVEFVPRREVQTSGWADYTDTVYTIGSPFVVNAGVTSNLPNNAGSSIITQLPPGVTQLYNGSVITPANDGDAYEISVRFKCSSSINEGAISVKLDIGGSLGVIIEESTRLTRGIGLTNIINANFTVYTGPTFVANGGTLKVESIAGNTSIWGIGYVIVRLHRAV